MKKRMIKEDGEPINFDANGLPNDPRVSVDPILPAWTTMKMTGVETAPDTTKQTNDQASGDGQVETDSNNYPLIQVIENYECQKEHCDKSVAILYDEIDLKKFFVFVCDCSLAFKRFTHDLENFTRTVCYDDLNQAQEAFNKITCYIDCNTDLPSDNSALIRAALSWVKPETDPSKIAPPEDSDVPDFTPDDKFTDYYDNKEEGQKEIGSTPAPSEKEPPPSDK